MKSFLVWSSPVISQNLQFLIGLLSRRSFSSSFLLFINYFSTSVPQKTYKIFRTNDLHSKLKKHSQFVFIAFLFLYFLVTFCRKWREVLWGEGTSMFTITLSEGKTIGKHSNSIYIPLPPYHCNNHRLHNTTTKGPYYTIYLLTWCATRTIVDYFGQQLNNSSVTV